MLRSRFQQGLDDLKSKLLAMAGMTESAVDLAMRAYAERVPELRLVPDQDYEITLQNLGTGGITISGSAANMA